MYTFLVYESSKGRKDLVFVSSTLDRALFVAKTAKEHYPEFTYRIYTVTSDDWLFDISTLTPDYEF